MINLRTLSTLLRSKKISSVELTKLYFDAIEKRNPDLNCYVHITYDEAIRCAIVADELIQKGEGGVLCGIPMTLKDNISTAGLQTSCCSKMLAGYRPAYDATVWARLKAQGAVLLGKTNMDEFAMGSTGESSVYGTARNPHGEQYVAGGSSGGGACAVASGLAPYAIGSDTGGSVRQPASFCGAVGLKGTYGALSRYGLIAYASSLDHVGVIAPCVEDATIIYNALLGADPRDSTSFSLPQVRLSADVLGLKIGVVRELYDCANAEVKQAVDAVLCLYEREGAQLVELSLPVLNYTVPTYQVLACAEASSNLARYDGIRYGARANDAHSVEEIMSKTRSQAFGKEVRKRILFGTHALSCGDTHGDTHNLYERACEVRRAITHGLNALFERCDVLLTPTVPDTAYRMGGVGVTDAQKQRGDLCTAPFNLAGLPAVSLPCGADANGLPVGVQICAPRRREDLALSVALAYEKVAPATPAVKGGVTL